MREMKFRLIKEGEIVGYMMLREKCCKNCRLIWKYSIDGKTNWNGQGRAVIDFDDSEQYTGLKDKKRTKEFPDGQPIYEGDIVKGVWQCDKKTIRTGVVKYWENFGLYGLDDKSGLISVVWKGCEIIGNIHQNKNLLDNNS